MSTGSAVLAGRHLLLRFRGHPCVTPVGCCCLALLSPHPPPARTRANPRAGGSMPGSRDSHPSAPPMTAIVVSKRNLPSFSERRPPFSSGGDALAASTSEPHRSDDEPSNTDVECALRSALGIGHAEVEKQGVDETAHEPPQPECEGSGNVSAEDPAILDWSLCDAPMDSSTRDFPATCGGAKRDKTGGAAGPSSAMSADPKFPAQKAGPKSSAVNEICGGGGGDGDVASCAVVTTPAKRRPRKRRAKEKAVARHSSVANGESSSDDDLRVERVLDGEPGSEESAWISELPGLVSSGETEDENDPVYSLKPLFTGAFGSSSGKKSKKCPEKRKRPNYFVAVQVDDLSVHKMAKKVQLHMQDQEPKVIRSLVAISTLHITLLVLRVDDEDDSLQRAKEALSRCYERVREDIEATPIVLKFVGLDHFKREVVYVKTADEDADSRLKMVADVCVEEFQKGDLDLSGSKPFVPHLTLAKVSRTSKRKTEISKLKEEWYAKYAEEPFGSQQVNSLQLLSMVKPKDEHGYYYCSLEHTFGDFTRDQENTDHSDCCAPIVPRKASVEVEKKLLALDAAKQEVKRKISTLTTAKLKELCGATDGVETSSEGDTPSE